MNNVHSRRLSITSQWSVKERGAEWKTIQSQWSQSSQQSSHNTNQGREERERLKDALDCFLFFFTVSVCIALSILPATKEAFWEGFLCSCVLFEDEDVSLSCFSFRLRLGFEDWIIQRRNKDKKLLQTGFNLPGSLLGKWDKRDNDNGFVSQPSQQTFKQFLNP